VDSASAVKKRFSKTIISSPGAPARGEVVGHLADGAETLLARALGREEGGE
jgi:hypothetical protein